MVLRGAGVNFCAGLDLKERGDNTERGPGAGLVRQRQISEIVIAMRRCPQPIIALMDGAASGGGFALALACDMRIATPTARMNAAFIKLGLSGCDIGVSYFLPRMLGASVAAELIMTGRFLHAPRAEMLGLVSKLAPADKLDDEARDLLADLLRTTPLGLRLTKEAFNHSIDAPGLEAAAIAMEGPQPDPWPRRAKISRRACGRSWRKRPPVYSAKAGVKPGWPASASGP